MSSSSSLASKLAGGSFAALSAATLVGASTSSAHADVVQVNDLAEGSVVLEDKGKSRAAFVDLPGGPDSLGTFAWGTPFASVSAPVRYPSLVAHLSGPGVAFKDFKMAEAYGAVVDARGDVYLWGRAITDGDADKGGLKRCLQGLNIAALAPTPKKLYALSTDGTIYALPTTTELLTAPTAGDSTPLRILDPFHLFHRRPQHVDYAPLTPAAPHHKTKFTSLAAGTHHLLALSKAGSVWGHAVSERANWHGQMADLVDVGGEAGVLPQQENIDWTQRHRAAGLQIAKTVDPYWHDVLPTTGLTPDLVQGLRPDEVKTARGLEPAEDIHWSTTIHPVPALETLQIPVKHIAAGNNASYLLLANERVLAFGNNAFGQVCIGAQKAAAANVSSPTEVVFPPGKTPTRITAGGDLVYFETKDTDGSAEVWAGGMGQWGGLGNGSWSQAQSTLVRIKGLSGLTEFSEALGRSAPIGVHHLTASPTAFTIAALATSGGRDVLVWGSNSSSQLANGKKNNVAVPVNLGPLPGADPAVGRRMILQEREKEVVRDLQGKKVGRKTVVQMAEAGYGGAAVYWKVQP